MQPTAAGNLRMSNPFFNTGEQRAAGVNDLFAAVAARYDLINDLQSLGLHRLWKRKVARLAKVKTGDRALDLCCGTGDLARALASRGASVVGLDFSPPMLRIAESRIRKAGIRPPGNVRFLEGDAEQIPMPSDSFDIVTIGYGLRNLKSWEAGLAEMRRVARTGGRLVVLEFGKPDNALWRALYFAHLRFSVPLLGRIFCGNAAAYAYILESLQHYPAQARVAEKMREMGLNRVQVVNLIGGIMSIHYGEK